MTKHKCHGCLFCDVCIDKQDYAECDDYYPSNEDEYTDMISENNRKEFMDDWAEYIESFYE